jgi:hypothetical protein
MADPSRVSVGVKGYDDKIKVYVAYDGGCPGDTLPYDIVEKCSTIRRTNTYTYIYPEGKSVRDLRRDLEDAKHSIYRTVKNIQSELREQKENQKKIKRVVEEHNFDYDECVEEWESKFKGVYIDHCRYPHLEEESPLNFEVGFFLGLVTGGGILIAVLFFMGVL